MKNIKLFMQKLEGENFRGNSVFTLYQLQKLFDKTSINEKISTDLLIKSFLQRNHINYSLTTAQKET